MDHPLKSMETIDFYRRQVIDPDEVKTILKEFNINIEEDKVQRYLNSYRSKFSEWQEFCEDSGAIFKKPNALLRELMEMHPMTVYGWLTNLRGRGVKGLSFASQRGKGERYGKVITLDRNWNPVRDNSEEMKNTPEWRNMEKYLRLRLSMTIIAKRLDDVVCKLMENGSYTITDEDLGIDSQRAIPQAGDARDIPMPLQDI